MTRKKTVLRRPKKRPYRTPVLRTYGDLKTLTMAKGGTQTDGGMPKTRTTGGP